MDSGASAVSAETGKFFEWLIQMGKAPFYLINMLPVVLRIILYAVFCLAVFGIFATHAKAILINRKRWKKKADSSLQFSYFCGTGFLQHKSIYQDAHNLLGDKTWFLISAAGAAYYIGQNKPESKAQAFFLSVLRLPLAAVGFLEMVIRVALGSVYLWLAYAVHWGLLAILQLATSVLIPVWSFIDSRMRVEQHCPHCYRTFKLPGYRCPACGRIHKDLVPGKTGILTARCKCGRFLPAALLAGRSRLDSVCPECEGPLAAAGAREFTLQLIGGDKSGKTAYLAAFWQVCRTAGEAGTVELWPFPEDKFYELERMSADGVTLPSSKSSAETYSIVHKCSGQSRDSIVVYDIPDEVLISGIYEQNPLNFAYSDGILIVFDPVSMKLVRRESEQRGEEIPKGSYSQDEAEMEDVVIEFIQQFSRMNNRPSSRMDSTPVAVIINKSDLEAVNVKIGGAAAARLYESDPAAFDNDISAAQSKICREYMVSLGLSNVINNLEGVFSKVRYFSASAMGHRQRKGMPFAPVGVVEPVAWIAAQKKSRAARLLNAAKDSADTPE